jgi:hypothetical protein
MALTKTTSILQLDAWQVVSAGTLVDGAVGTVSDSFDTVLYLEIAPVSTNATDGVEAMVEVSYADDDWMQLTTVKGTAETVATTTLNDAAATAGDPDITLTSAGADFNVVGRKWFIKDATAGNSESVRTKSVATNTVTLCQDLLRTHADGSDVYDRVDEWTIAIPFAVAKVRVLLNNVDADCDCMFTTRLSKVTALG